MSQFYPPQSQQSGQPGQQYPQGQSAQQWQPPTMYAPTTAPNAQPPVYSQPPKKRKSRKKLWLIIGVVLAIIVIASAASQKGNTPPSSDTTTTSSQTTTTAQQPTQPQTQATQAQPTQASSQPTTAPSTPTVNYAQFSDGTYTVGKDIQPGTYRTRAASPGCYFARLSGFGGTIGEIIANANTDAPAIVTIKATDKGFTSTNCGTWTNDLSAITSSQTSFDDGMYIVGTDIKPGTYRTRTASPGCYFARLSGFGGTTGEIIANANTDAFAIITIVASDKGFEASSCGTWTNDLSAITTSKTTFGDGMYIVGTDIQPGTYKNSGQANCYYARLSGFGGTTDEIIANDNTDSSTIVTISASDKGFEASSCGTWTKV